MNAGFSLSPGFLAALADAYAALGPGSVSQAFLADLQRAYAALDQTASVDFNALGRRFDVWREWAREQVHVLRKNLPADDPLNCPVSLFRTMGYGRLETAHTRTLAWLLDPRGEHGFGDRLLRALLGHLVARRRLDRLTVDGRVEAEFPIDRRATDEGGRLDVFARGDWWIDGAGPARWVLVIEAKIDAAEGCRQLEKYETWLERNAPGRESILVFLTQDSRRAETAATEWHLLSYRELVGVFRTVYGDLADRPGYHFLRYYLAGVLQDVCGWGHAAGGDGAGPYNVLSYLTSAQVSAD